MGFSFFFKWIFIPCEAKNNFKSLPPIMEKKKKVTNIGKYLDFFKQI
jgi:hypothetical protein